MYLNPFLKYYHIILFLLGHYNKYVDVVISEIMSSWGGTWVETPLTVITIQLAAIIINHCGSWTVFPIFFRHPESDAGPGGDFKPFSGHFETFRGGSISLLII